MIFHIYQDEEGNTIQEFDLDGIEYFLIALEKLKDVEPGEGFQTPTITVDDEGIPESAQNLILKRAEEE